MSQFYSQAPGPHSISVPIAKFSHNITPCGTKSFVWTHINNRKDLDLVIRNASVVDDCGNYQDCILMKVTGGAEILETQDLGQVVKFCRDFDPTTGEENPVDIVVKSPFLAMRYPKSLNTVRRIQVKFHSDSDFKKIVNVMNDLGLQITHKDGSVPTIGSSMSFAPSSVLPATAPGGTAYPFADTLRRPASSSTMSSSAMRGSSPTKPDVSSSPVKPDFKVPLQPDTSFSDQRQANRIPYSTPHLSNAFLSSPVSSGVKPFSPQSRAESFNQPPSHHSHSLYVSQMERESQNWQSSQSILSPLNSGNTDTRAAASLYISQMQPQQGEALEHLQATSRLSSTSPFFSSAAEKEIMDAKGPQSMYVQRPSSTPIEHSDPSKMWIPPKRELPFPKLRKSSNSKTSTPDLPPTLARLAPGTRAASHPKSPEAHTDVDVTTTPAKKPAPKKRIAQRKARTKPAAQQVFSEEALVSESTVESIPKLASIQEEPEDLSPLAARSAATSFRPASAPGLISKAILPPKKRIMPPTGLASVAKRPKMVNVATQTEELAGSGHAPATAQRAAPASTPPELVADTLSAASPPENDLNEIDAFIAKHNPRPKPRELWQSPQYVDADEAHRQKMLNDFICENLENPDFLQLCQDAEISWRRIGLGM